MPFLMRGGGPSIWSRPYGIDVGALKVACRGCKADLYLAPSPWPARAAECLGSGAGVILDDVAAGVWGRRAGARRPRPRLVLERRSPASDPGLRLSSASLSVPPRKGKSGQSGG